MSDLYENTAVREFAEQMVRREVFYCVSSLVSGLAQSNDACSALSVDWEDEILPLCQQDDYETPADDYTSRMSRDECVEYLEALSIACRDDESTATLREAVMQNAKDEGLREFCDERNIEPHTIEAYEHWIVSDWLADKLEARGEMVGRDILGLTIWGRPTTGQAISMDSVILHIAQDALNA